MVDTKKTTDNEKASKKPGEAKGPKTDEQKAAEQKPTTAKKTNPVAEATEIESKDPYAEGKHIANPEPNNGKGEDPEKWDAAQARREAKEAEASQKASASVASDIEERDAEASTPDEN
jgi:hypothetical protein